MTVYEPHLSVGDEHVAVDYVGYPAVAVLAHLFGADWHAHAETVEFRALDGYVSRIDAARFLAEGASIVFARGDGSPFTVDNLAQNQTGVPLGPYYLVWDNVGNPALLEEGARNWPYQVAEVNLVNLSDAALLPEGLDARFHEGAALAKTHCLNCHKINGYGGGEVRGQSGGDRQGLRGVRVHPPGAGAALRPRRDHDVAPLRAPARARARTHRQGAVRLSCRPPGGGVDRDMRPDASHSTRWRP